MHRESPSPQPRPLKEKALVAIVTQPKKGGFCLLQGLCSAELPEAARGAGQEWSAISSLPSFCTLLSNPSINSLSPICITLGILKGLRVSPREGPADLQLLCWMVGLQAQGAHLYFPVQSFV